jgi:exosortase A-associated hydrolase 1
MLPDVRAVKMASEGSILYGVVHDPRSTAKRGILMVAAGAYRVGPHRQFLLLARDWAAGGIPVMRFDYQGQGDSEGAGAFSFDSLMHDIRSAIDCFTSAVPGIERVVLWGLCDAGLNSLLYAGSDPRVDGLVLVNPPVDDPDSGLRHRGLLRYHYLPQLLKPMRLVGRLARNRLNVLSALTCIRRHIAGSIRPNASGSVDRYLEVLGAFKGRSLVILSERDVFAIEFKAKVMRTQAWERLVEDSKVAALHLPNADHSFTSKELRDQVSIWTADWIRSLRDPFWMSQVLGSLSRP